MLRLQRPPGGDRLRIAVDGDETGDAAPQNGPRIAAGTEGAVHMDLARSGPQRLKHLVEQHRSMALVLFGRNLQRAHCTPSGAAGLRSARARSRASLRCRSKREGSQIWNL